MLLSPPPFVSPTFIAAHQMLEHAFSQAHLGLDNHSAFFSLHFQRDVAAHFNFLGVRGFAAFDHESAPRPFGSSTAHKVEIRRLVLYRADEPASARRLSEPGRT